MKNKEVFTIKLDDQDIEFAVVKPTVEIQMGAQKYYNKIFCEALQSGALFKQSLLSYMKKQNLWDDDKQKENDKLQQIIIDGEKTLSRGNISLKEAKQIAVSMRVARVELRSLVQGFTELYPNTAEGQADTAKFNYLVAACIVDNTTGKRHFATVEDYLSKPDDMIAITGLIKFSELYYGLNNTDKELPENQFLLKYKFVNNDLQFINKDGKLTDVDGRLIDEYGYYIDEHGNRTDIDGNPVDEKGYYKFESEPFLDENGQPIIDSIV